MEDAVSEGSTNPRTSIDSQLKLIQQDLDSVEKRLVVIFEELLGPRPAVMAPENRMREEKKSETKGWFNKIILRLDNFRNQLERIKKLEKDLKKSVTGPLENVTEERKLPVEV